MRFDHQKLCKILENSGKSQNKFLKDAGVSNATMRTSNPNGRNSKPSIELLEKLLNYYGKSVLEVYEMNELDCKHVLHNLDDIIEKSFAPLPKSNAISLTSSHSIQFAPLVGQAAANPAGRLGVDVEENLGEIPTRWPIPPGCEDPNGFWVEVDGDSMSPVIPESSIVYVSPNREIKNGDIAFFRIEEQTYIKKVIFLPDRKAFILSSLNEKYEDLLIDPTAKTIQQSGVVLAVAQRLK